MSWKFLGVAAVEALHTEQILRFGGSYGLRDRGLLESAVMRAENKLNFDPGASLPEMAASLSFGLIKNHAFIDGNKRIGLVSLVSTLKMNGFILPVDADTQEATVKRVASSEMTEKEWTDWVREHASPIQ